jgi:release factor glutamine methyltransferase
VTDVNDEFVAELVAAGVERREARWLVEEFVPGGDRDAAPALRQAANRRLNGEPLQYIIGHWPFRTLDLDVDERVLIPRPESEQLVDIAQRELAATNVTAPTILDLGTGSGAIGLSLLSELAARGITATLIAIDESSDALDVARRNAAKHHLYAASFVHSSWFSALDGSLRGRVDLIVANPPYVAEAEFVTLDPVLRHEPYGALVASDAGGVPGFGDLETIISEAPGWLRASGVLVCEHASIHRDVALQLARSVGFREVDDHLDMAGLPRVLVARR